MIRLLASWVQRMRALSRGCKWVYPLVDPALMLGVSRDVMRVRHA
jgi:hypothetical protein